MKTTGFFFCGTCALLLAGAAGCSTAAHRVEAGGQDALVTLYGVDTADWNQVAARALDSLLASGALNRPGKKPVVMISRIRNYTDLHLERGILTAKLRQGILRSGQASVTSALGAGSNLDLAVRRIRAREFDDLFAAGTIPPRGSVIAPDMSISGEIIQQNARAGRNEECYFLFHVVLTDLRTGVALWESNTEIAKQSTRSIL